MPFAQRSVLSAAGVILAVVLAASPSAALTSPGDVAAKPQADIVPVGPRLSIAVDNGHSLVVAGDLLEYTVSVRNLGDADITGLVVTQSVPSDLELDSSDSGGVVLPDGVRWKVDLKAYGESIFHSSMTVKEASADRLRLATVACAGVFSEGSPLVCASHSDQLPADPATDKARSASGEPGSGWWYVGGGIAVGAVVLASLAALVLRGRASVTGRARNQPGGFGL